METHSFTPSMILSSFKNLICNTNRATSYRVVLQRQPINASVSRIYNLRRFWGFFPFKSQLQPPLLTSRLCMPPLGRDPGYLVHLEVPEYLIRSEKKKKKKIKRITQVFQKQHFHFNSFSES